MTPNDFLLREPGVLRDVSQIWSELVFVTDRNLDRGHSTGAMARRLQRRMQSVLDLRFEFLERNDSRRIIKDRDCAVGWRQLNYPRDGSGFELMSSAQDRVQRFLRMKFLNDPDEQR
ncbi:MAG: hypothetical protein QOG51_605 [Verrucomicrobiota bacterium]